MILLTTDSHPTAVKWAHPNHGRLLTPRCDCRAAWTAHAGIPWAVDNDGFNGFKPDAFRKTLYKAAGLPGCLFVVAPDVFDKEANVGDHAATLALFNEWHDELRLYMQPVAFVLQNGATVDNVPWDRIDAVFIGGCTAWKLGEVAASIVAEAKRRGVWVHMGRVNTLRRIRYAQSIGVDSIDGTKWAKFRDTYMADGIRAVSAPTQMRLTA